MKESQEREIIKKYLLGNLENEDARQDIERRLMTDDTFEEEISICEDELIDDYLDGRLNRQERSNFENHFLLSPDVRKNLEFAHTFKTHLEEQKRAVQKRDEKNVFFNWLRQSLRAPELQIALVVLLLGIGLFGAWYFLSRQSELASGATALQQAYAKTRPFESRIADLDYSPLSQTRGSNENQPDALLRRQAEMKLLDAAAKNRNAESLYWLGKFYLLEKNIDKAIEYFEEAAKLEPKNARLYGDLGAALLEKGKRAATEKDGAASSELLDKSLKHLEEAIRLNSALPEPRFNRALSLEAMHLLEQAKQAWREYLELDSNSKWAEEARQHLQKLEAQKPQNLTSDELEKSFLLAFRSENETEASKLISQNREIITEKYLPQKLAMSQVESAGQGEYLQALIYAGELEKKTIGDAFALDLANFYKKVSPPDLEALKPAQAWMRNGCKLLIAGKFAEAFLELNRARQIFVQTGDIWEAKLSEILIVYSFLFDGKIKNALPLAEDIADFCRQRNYKWLLGNTLYWLAGTQRATGAREKAKINYKNCLEVAEEIKDSLIQQKILAELSRQSDFVGQHKKALEYLQRAFESIHASEISLRQKWINYSESVEILANARLLNSAKAVSMENLHLAKELNDPLFIVNSQLDSGILHSRIGDFAAARIWFAETIKNAETLSDNSERKLLLTKSLLELGHIERKLNDSSKAAQFYEQALAQIESAETPFYLYEIQKSRLLAYLSLNNEDEIEKLIPQTLELAEKYREQIAQEQERNSFFNNEQNIYDIAVAHELKHGRRERAYNYLETSNSRSLLDWLQKGATVKEDRKNVEIIFNENAKPFDYKEIRARMPEGVQILQYAVLEDKVAIWLISRNKSEFVSTEIDAEKLSQKVKTYVELLAANNDARQAEAEILARELYNLLISPIANQLDPTKDICLIPHKILFHLPFAALTAPDGKPFLADFNFFYAPSANIFLLCTDNAERKSASGDEALLSIGNPLFDRREFDDLEYLPAAEDEAQEIARLYPGAQPLLGANATKAAFQKSLSNAEIIHFAGHYVVRHGSPLSSSMLLAQSGNNPEESAFTNAELIRRKLPRAKLVVLSACQTGVEQYYNGEGLIGLSRTFLAAGAPLVVGSQWKVDSDATAELMKKFHFYRRQEKLSATAALRRAQLEMYNTPDGRFRKPYFWASFAAFGGFAKF